MKMPLTFAGLIGRVESIELLANQVADTLAYYSMEAASELREVEDVCAAVKRYLKLAAKAGGCDDRRRP